MFAASVIGGLLLVGLCVSRIQASRGAKKSVQTLCDAKKQEAVWPNATLHDARLIGDLTHALRRKASVRSVSRSPDTILAYRAGELRRLQWPGLIPKPVSRLHRRKAGARELHRHMVI